MKDKQDALLPLVPIEGIAKGDACEDGTCSPPSPTPADGDAATSETQPKQQP